MEGWRCTTFVWLKLQNRCAAWRSASLTFQGSEALVTNTTRSQPLTESQAIAGLIPGDNLGNAVNIAAYHSAYGTLATMAGVPLVGNPEAVAQRPEELTSIVGTLAEALSHTAPAVNTATNNNDLIVAT